MVDALASGASTGNGVEVRVLSWAPNFPNKKQLFESVNRFLGDVVPLIVPRNQYDALACERRFGRPLVDT